MRFRLITAHKVLPNGIHLGIIGTTVQTAVRCARPKSIEQSPAAGCETESRPDSDFQRITAATKRVISWQTSPRTPN
jgi:hypothetical protein